MKFSANFPYPVLADNNDDYTKKSSFDTLIDVKQSFGQLSIEMRAVLNDRKIEQLIANNHAEYALHIECSPTSFRKVFKSKDSNISIEIPSEQLSGKIEVHTFILATDTITNYENPNLDSFYSGFPVQFEKGSILALGEAADIHISEDDLEAQNLPSIINVRRLEKGDKMTVDLVTDYILVGLPTDMYQHYAANANSRLKDTILSLVFLPVLIEVFATIREHEEEYSEYKWFQVLERIFEASNHQLHQISEGSLSVMEAAQLVLHNPLQQAFKEVEKLNRMDD
ncbi:hypothetical protein ACQKM9_20900 [Viridibacillus sp. NPDC093762]|uniref:hypothetical protein n=1 Tax=Viridibacillus sp. NPDC093762 TaxID=3390720 RepID=UPI003D09309C